MPEGGGLGNFGLGLVRQLNFGPASFPDNVKALMLGTDVVRTEYAGAQLGTLLKQAPTPNSSGAANYTANTVNPFLNTQLNGFFSLEARQNFWDNTASSQVMPYLTSAIAVPPPSGEGPYPKSGAEVRKYRADWGRAGRSKRAHSIDGKPDGQLRKQLRNRFA